MTDSDRSGGKLPSSVALLLSASDHSERERAWQEFVERHSRLILSTARSMGGDYDAAMDRYSFVLEGLRANGFRRFRAYETNGRGKFTTWLVVVVRRLCVDFHRSRYGRVADLDPEDPVSADERRTRRALVDLLGEHADFSRLRVDHGGNPEHAARREELRGALAEELRELEDRDRLLLALRFENGLTAREIARIMDYKTQFHVYRRVNRVLALLKERLAERGIEDPHP